MNTLKKKILSVLLLAFTFFVVHDYVINYASPDVKSIMYSLSDSDEVLLDLHEDIHTMFEISLKPLVLQEQDPTQTNLIDKEYIFISSLIFTLNKPPVI